MKTKISLIVGLLLTIALHSLAEKKEKKDWKGTKSQSVRKMDEENSSLFYMERISSILSLTKKQEKELEKIYRSYHKKRKGIMGSDNSYANDRVELITAKEKFDLAVDLALTDEQKILLSDYHQNKQVEAEYRFKQNTDTSQVIVNEINE